MTTNEIIAAVQLISDMESAKIDRETIKGYSIEAVTEAMFADANVCVQVHEVGLISNSFFFFVNTESGRIYDAHHLIVFPEPEKMEVEK